MNSPGNFHFMGLIENFEICIDGATRIPVQVSGQISRIEKPLFLPDQQRKNLLCENAAQPYSLF